MKRQRNIWMWVLLVGMVVLTGCESQNTYSKLREQEKQKISDFIQRNGITVVEEWPKVWNSKLYYHVPDYDDFYIQVIDSGNVNCVAQTGQTILLRFIKYSLDVYSDTIRYWTTEDGGDPISFQFGNTSEDTYCAGWTATIDVVKYSGSHCRIICPSKLGFSEDNSSVTPYGYEILFNVKNF